MRSLGMRDGDSSAKSPRPGGCRRKLIKASVVAAGIIVTAAILFHDSEKTGKAGSTPSGPPTHENPVPIKANPQKITAPGEFRSNVAFGVNRQPTKDNSERAIIESLSVEFPYGGMDCRMIPAAEAEGIRSRQSPVGLGPEYSLEGPFQSLESENGPSENMRSALHGLKNLYVKKDVWAVLAFVRYLDSLNLESASSTLYGEYERMWIEGGPDGVLPDPICMERIAVSILLLRGARNDLSNLLAADPSLAQEVLNALQEPTRGTVLSGAVGAALADPANPSIEGLFDFLPHADKIALIEMYDGSLPESERIPGIKDGSSLSLSDSGLWGLLDERMRRFKALQEEKRRDADGAAELE